MSNDFAYRPTRFWEEYKTQADGTVQTREYVELARPGNQQMSTMQVRISDKVKAAPEWDNISEYYDAWRKGHSAPVHGTPLGAWPGLTPEQVEAFKASGLQTVEDVAGMAERVMNMVKIPNVRRLKDEAGMFLQLKDQRGVELKLQQQSEEIAALKAMLEDRADLDAIGAVAPKRRGRPPKQESQPVDIDLEDEAA